MVRGFLAGIVTGTVVSTLVLGVASLLLSGPEDDAPRPRVDTVEVTPGSGFDPRREDRAATLPTPETRPDAGDPQSLTPPALDGFAPLAETDTTPAATPETGDADALGPVPAPDGDSGRPAAPDDAPISSTGPARAPDAPRTGGGTPSADTPEQPGRPGAEPPDAAPQVDGTAPDAPAFRRNATAFANPRNKPLMAVVLIADGTGTVRIETLTSFPYPLSIAVDADWSGADAAARRYRDAGFEVLLRVELPRDTSAAETTAALRDGLDRVPQAVALLEGAAGGLPLSDVATLLARTGHGVVIRAAPRPSTYAASPVAVLHDDLDDEGQDVSSMEDNLNQAAAAADRQQGVIVVGRLRADTLQALSLWSGRGGARSVALAPVSAVLSTPTDTGTDAD